MLFRSAACIEAVGCVKSRLERGLVDHWARERQLEYVELNVLQENRSAQRLYEKHGYMTAVKTMKKKLK